MSNNTEPNDADTEDRRLWHHVNPVVGLYTGVVALAVVLLVYRAVVAFAQMPWKYAAAIGALVGGVVGVYLLGAVIVNVLMKVVARV